MRDKTVCFKVSLVEKEYLRLKAKENHTSISGYVRSKVLGGVQ